MIDLYSCPSCGADTQRRIDQRRETHTVRGVAITLEAQVAVCLTCGQDMSDFDLDNDLLQRLYAIREEMDPVMRRNDVAVRAGVPVAEVMQASAEEVRAHYAETPQVEIVAVATQVPATYWRVGSRYYLDDPGFGEVVAIDDLRYSPTLGLY